MIDGVVGIGAGMAFNSRSVNSLSATEDIGLFSQVGEQILALEQTISLNETAVADFANDTSSMPTHELMIRLESARLEMMLALQVRNRIVEAVQEIYRTQV